LRLQSRIKVELFLALIGVVVLFLLMLIIVGNVALRFLGYPLPGALELSELCLAVVIFSSLAYTQIMGEHVRIGLVYDRLPSKIRFSLALLSLVLGLTFCVFLMWQSGMEGFNAYVAKEFSFGLIKFPTWIPKLVIPVGGFLLGVELLFEIIDKIARR